MEWEVNLFTRYRFNIDSFESYWTENEPALLYCIAANGYFQIPHILVPVYHVYPADKMFLQKRIYQCFR